MKTKSKERWSSSTRKKETPWGLCGTPRPPCGASWGPHGAIWGPAPVWAGMTYFGVLKYSWLVVLKF
jgi:hypothetical protein